MSNNVEIKCPYCGGNLMVGTLLTCHTGTVYWLPEGEKLGLFYNPIRDKKLLDAGSIIFHANDLGICKINSYVCKNCKKLIVDYGTSVGVTMDAVERK